MVPPQLTSLDVDVWAFAFAAFVTLVSVALAGLSAAHVSHWDRVIEDEDSSWVAALAERTKHIVEATYPRLTKALSSSKISKDNHSEDIHIPNQNEKFTPSTKVSMHSLSTPPSRR